MIDHTLLCYYSHFSPPPFYFVNTSARLHRTKLCIMQDSCHWLSQILVTERQPWEAASIFREAMAGEEAFKPPCLLHPVLLIKTTSQGCCLQKEQGDKNCISKWLCSSHPWRVRKTQEPWKLYFCSPQDEQQPEG